ncbi:unnamed protein product [Phaedon cochleariae]|uniref:Uncharacterized protein n=1 Tax=Phaedon cochleariae TaxID=80249 RepID=A0A9N9SK01_PHACE|nr:unnamed protein product [Phaedon cochleariae]
MTTTLSDNPLTRRSLEWDACIYRDIGTIHLRSGCILAKKTESAVTTCDCSVPCTLADLKSDSVRRWVDSQPSPTLPKDNSKPFKGSTINNNTLDFWSPTCSMPMLLQQPPGHVILSSHETDQPLDFTMSKFKTKGSATVASQLKQFGSFTAQQQMMLLQNNGLYYNRSNNNKSFTRGSTPSSSSSEEDGVGPPVGSPRSPPLSPLQPRRDGLHLLENITGDPNQYE